MLSLAPRLHLKACIDAPRRCERRTLRAFASAGDDIDRGRGDGDHLRSSSRRQALLGMALTAGTTMAPWADAAPIPPFCGVASNALPVWAYTTPWDERMLTADTPVWVRTIGKAPSKSLFSRTAPEDKRPLMVIHGGPGLPSRYLETVELLSGLGRQVVFYDQHGCGNSAYDGARESDFTLAKFVDEAIAVRRSLGPGPVHVMGHGWGALLALEMVPRPPWPRFGSSLENHGL